MTTGTAWTERTDLMWEMYRAERDLVLDDEMSTRRTEYRQGAGREERFLQAATMGLPLSSFGMAMGYAGARPPDVERWLPVAVTDTTSWLRRLFAEAQGSGATVAEVVRMLALYGHLGSERQMRELSRVQRTTALGPGWVDSE